MISNQEEDEFVAVRVQDPRTQNEGSWNSYVDYKIFLHTNSKAFTAKTSCVRRRYSEFVWLRKKLQKNAGLVPVPELPGKSFFSFSNEDFLERRRKGLQAFLDNVVSMTVCLSDSQLHLFLQTQLPVGHILDCVQGHTPYTVTDAILTYASSNRGFAQAQEDDSIKEPSLTVSYESMESPAPHQPCLQPKEIFSPELLSRNDSDPLEGLLEVCDQVTVELPNKAKSSVRVLQKHNHLEAVVEDPGPTEVSFFVGESQDVAESLSPAERTQQRRCQIQTPVEVHSPMGTDFEENRMDSLFEGCSIREESVTTLDTEEKTVPLPDTEKKADQREGSVEAKIEKVSEKHVISDVSGINVFETTEVHVEDASCPEGFKNLDQHKEPDNKKSDESERKEETPLQSQIHEDTNNVHSVPEVQSSADDTVQQMDQVEQEEDLVGTKEDSDEDNHSISNESIIKVSDEESICEEAEDSLQAANGYVKTSPEDVPHWAHVDASTRNILDLHMNGCPVEKEELSAREDEDLQYINNKSELKQFLDLNSTVTGVDLTENSDFSILESGSAPGLAQGNRMEQETWSSLPLDASEGTHEVAVHYLDS
ncbi:sorting nexin-11 [Etheostoma spectabile]|nr:sorting nexin-11 [Etheostoma spectabile]XP_032358887.1 sorting nexin-11 [Etheostoma spectabile]